MSPLRSRARAPKILSAFQVHRGIYRNDFYVNHPTCLSQSSILEDCRLNLVTLFRFFRSDSSRFILHSPQVFHPWIFHQKVSPKNMANLLSKIQGWSDLLLQFSPFCLGFLVLLGSLEVSFSWNIPSRFFLKINDKLPMIFPKRCHYYCMILL